MSTTGVVSIPLFQVPAPLAGLTDKPKPTHTHHTPPSTAAATNPAPPSAAAPANATSGRVLSKVA